MLEQSTATPPPISLMAAELRDALTAIGLGKGPAAVASLMAIDPASWQSIEHRLASVIGSGLRTLLLGAVEQARPA